MTTYAMTPVVKKTGIVSMIETAVKNKQKNFQVFTLKLAVADWKDADSANADKYTSYQDVEFGALTEKDIILMDADTATESVKVADYGINCTAYSVAVGGSGTVRFMAQETPTEDVEVSLVRFPYYSEGKDDGNKAYEARIEALETILNGKF